MKSTPATDLEAAARIAAANLEQPGDWKLVSAENLLSGPDADPHRWRLTFKKASLIPDGPGGIIGKGGERFLEVDLSRGEVVSERGGE